MDQSQDGRGTSRSEPKSASSNGAGVSFQDLRDPMLVLGFAKLTIDPKVNDLKELAKREFFQVEQASQCILTLCV